MIAVPTRSVSVADLNPSAELREEGSAAVYFSSTFIQDESLLPLSPHTTHACRAVGSPAVLRQSVHRRHAPPPEIDSGVRSGVYPRCSITGFSGRSDHGAGPVCTNAGGESAAKTEAAGRRVRRGIVWRIAIRCGDGNRWSLGVGGAVRRGAADVAGARPRHPSSRMGDGAQYRAAVR